MTVAQAVAACTAAGLVVLGAEVVGRQVMVTVENYDADSKAREGRTHAIVKKLGVPVTVSFSGGAGNVRLWLMTNGE